MSSSTSSLERLYPGNSEQAERIAGNDTYQLHLERYRFAGEHLAPGLIGDIACGAGYGCHLLVTEYGDKIETLTGVDNSAEAIKYAKEAYTHPLIDFQLFDAMEFRPTVPFSTIISLETIEHLEKPAAFIAHMVAQLKTGGRFIASAPVTPSMDANPYHLQDFTPRTFKKLFTAAGLVELQSMMQIQPYKPFKLFGKKKGRVEHLRKGLAGYYLKHPGKFWLRIRSLLTDGFTNKYLLVVFEKR
ncbi:MAG TPA: class I SAM-dependent methyltransferase [Chitinophagaceae bacterium]|jgi:2-polyprenyl-3-methyl-5-hydroxy-6-metoxy-1,4-benzoquinol methylase|nr:class I SAM-dependent methyltransferase [Chitinophagaceae bacterium]